VNLIKSHIIYYAKQLATSQTWPTRSAGAVHAYLLCLNPFKR